MSGREITRVSKSQTFLYSQKLQLTSDAFVLTNIPAKTGIQLFFQLKVTASAFSGSFHQDVTIDLVCNTS
jgi:uncharacterized lipoprotein YmbA